MKYERIEQAMKRIGSSPEYLGIAGFIAFFESLCRFSLRKRIAKKYAEDVKTLFLFLRKRIKKEMEKFPSVRGKRDFLHAVHKNLPAYQKFYDLDT